MDRSLARDAALVGAVYLVLLTAVAGTLTLGGRPDLVAFLTDPFTDPVGLVLAAFAFFLAVSAVRRARRRNAKR